MMESADSLLSIAKAVVTEAAAQIIEENVTSRVVEGVLLSGREVKLTADRILDQIVLRGLYPTGISVLSEESGYVDRGNDDGLLWIVDPLDGSVNYLRRAGACAVSIALWKKMSPVFGVVYRVDTGVMAWGGRGLGGAWQERSSLRTSTISDRKAAVLYTGIPARFDVGDPVATVKLNQMMFSFGKVRMLGSATCSLLLVAAGVGDAYWEKDIMLWDVAAGLALVEGAGGLFRQTDIHQGEWQTTVLATNGVLNV
jgi:myo-inositol-1(or 4)-monophosphatase